MSDEIYYDQNVYNSGEEENPNSGKKGFAITSLVLGIVSLVCCCCGLGYIAAPLSIIFAIIALVKHHGGKAMSIVGIVLSSIVIIGLIAFHIEFGPVLSSGVAQDYFQFAQEYEAVFDEYDETGELPDYIEKYAGPEYDSFWESSGYKDFYEFFDSLEDQMMSQGTSASRTNN